MTQKTEHLYYEATSQKNSCKETDKAGQTAVCTGTEKRNCATPFLAHARTACFAGWAHFAPRPPGQGRGPLGFPFRPRPLLRRRSVRWGITITFKGHFCPISTETRNSQSLNDDQITGQSPSAATRWRRLAQASAITSLAEDVVGHHFRSF